MTEALHTKYRPKKFADVVGQQAVVASLQGMVKEGGQRAYLLSGPAGVGKTTLARICARALGCAARNVRELDAASCTGVDDMRAATAALRYEPFGDSPGRAMILDECHRLSAQAWDSLLKQVEEPPAHAYWFFCTTNAGRVPATIRSRCAAFPLGAVAPADLERLFRRVAEAEGAEYHPDVARVIVGEADGSPRRMLVNMAMCRGAGSKKDAREILRAAAESDAVGGLLRFLSGGCRGGWKEAARLVDGLEGLGESPEGVRIVINNYFSKAAIGAKNDREASHALNVLEAFAEPFAQSDQRAPLLRAIGRLVYAEE